MCVIDLTGTPGAVVKMKRCRGKCKQWKPESEFNFDGPNGGTRNECKVCRNAKKRFSPYGTGLDLTLEKRFRHWRACESRNSPLCP